jgi:hypothetical protein
MPDVEIKILKYTFNFRRLSWREEFSMKFEPKENRLSNVLAHALVDVSGMRVGSVQDAKKLLKQIPTSIIDRMYIIYKGSQPEPKNFSTMGLYRAPEPRKFMGKITKEAEQREEVIDKVEREMAAKFGTKELQEARATEREMLRKSGGRGLTPATPDFAPEKKK